MSTPVPLRSDFDAGSTAQAGEGIDQQNPELAKDYKNAFEPD
jgi:hypothetical protein